MSAQHETVMLHAALDRAIAELLSAIEHVGTAFQLAATLSDGPAVAIEAAVKRPFNTLATRKQLHAEHRRAHRSGHPGKIEGDPELEAFIRARIDTSTYAQIVSEVRLTFPPGRQCSMSGLGRWWQKRRAE